MKKYKQRYISFQYKMTGTVILFLVFTFILIAALFYSAGMNIKEETLKNVSYSAGEISNKLDDMVSNIYSVSDAFAIDERMEMFTEQTYKGKRVEKRKAIMQIFNQIFASYDLLKSNEKMSAIYTMKGELFNFIDPDNDKPRTIQQLLVMGINDKDNLAKFCWYPVRDNFLKTDSGQELRKQKAVFGSRRVFSRLKSSYTCIHIFAVNEEKIYEQYKDLAEQYYADIYILTQNGELISASDENVLRAGYVEEDLKTQILGRQGNVFEVRELNRSIIVAESPVNHWLTVISVPADHITATANSLFRRVTGAITICIGLACIMLIFFYRSFMKPVSKLNQSMQRVNAGELNAYVESGRNDEIGRMIGYYNAMLASINQYITERLQMDRKKKELELEVLMNQINPHFLYNTLETIVWKSNEAGRPDIGRIAASLGRLYRLSVNMGELFVSLKQEIEHVMAYVKIQENRYEDQFKFELKVNYEEIYDLFTIKILLQPIVENSFLYAMDGLERTLKIRLSIHVREKDVVIKVADTGAGMDKSRLEAARRQIKTGIREHTSEEIIRRRKSTGIGLHNVYERLQLYFGAEYDLQIHSKEGVGTVTILKIPKISKTEAQAMNEAKKNEEN